MVRTEAIFLFKNGPKEEKILYCCAHVATIIWYLGKGNHSHNKPKSDTFSTTVKDAALVTQTDSELELDD